MSAIRPLHEKTIRDFFLGNVSAAHLSEETLRAVEGLDAVSERVHIRDMEENFWVTREMAIQLCGAVLAGELQPEALRTIAFALIASDHFEWDDDLLSDILWDWSSPEVNYPLTTANIEKFKTWLAGLEPYPGRARLDPKVQTGRLIRQTEKKAV